MFPLFYNKFGTKNTKNTKDTKGTRNVAYLYLLSYFVTYQEMKKHFWYKKTKEIIKKGGKIINNNNIGGIIWKRY